MPKTMRNATARRKGSFCTCTSTEPEAAVPGTCTPVLYKYTVLVGVQISTGTSTKRVSASLA